MSLFKKRLWFNFFLVFFLLFFVSCSAIDKLTKPAEPKNENPQDQEQISRVESELTEVKKSQEILQHDMQLKDANIKKLQENILKLEKKISFLEEKKEAPNLSKYKIEYKTPSVLYKKARNLLIEEDYISASDLFGTFIKNHPRDELADNAVYWLGECHYSLGDYKKALSVFKNLEIKYPKSEKVPDALLKTGYSYLSLDDSNRAHHYLKQVLKKYPFSPAAEKAQEKLKSFQ